MSARRREVACAFGVVLRDSRRERNMTQESLAERADLDRTYPSLLERGLRQPTLTYLFAIADALGMDPAELVRLTRRGLHS
ncbi:MAG: family transcriptional regulator [Gammaproteobacteria bacterium]|jgi:transcriptional regulator with XRE-family HTH domain|nr:family transcriptional regulator [Gammaproteobacteria bacterium]